FQFVAVQSVMAEYGVAFDETEVDERRKTGQLMPLVSRACTEDWWRLQLRKLTNKTLERVARDLELVGNHNVAYCSSESVYRQRYRQQKNKQLLENLIAIDEDDPSNVFTLFELAQKTTSNPYIRRSEMFVRLKGCDTIAQAQNHDCLFITMTCPSKFHSSSKGNTNRAWLEAGKPTTQDAQNYLCSTWADIRRDFDDNGIEFYGMRSVEPHHDGCPHWHLLVYCLPEHTEEIKATFTKRCLQVDGTEKGAKKRRVTFEDIDFARGSGISYVAKYLSKSIDGLNVTDNKTSLSGIEAAERIVAWARVNGIRQFQFFGLPSVTTWRELRKIKADLSQDEKLNDLDEVQRFAVEQCRRAAHASDWAAFCHAMGGIFVKRSVRPIYPHYHVPQIFDELLDDHVPKQTRYGDEAVA
ncbi:replication endonuclease, partial [Thaumasiovibrio sp. DFM-14]|uniref:replication endonuclease n=1 Tax=Thaumasiovibrio sp. DFM-14 TaxID=3384792 RepID=UPI0039A1425A